nr:alpha-(1,3)-fucosyltransferase 10 isoform X4 [Vicugna pacos]
MPSQAHSEPRISALHGGQAPAGTAVEEIGTQMVAPCEAVVGCGPTKEHLVTRRALCQSPRAGRHGAGSEEEASGVLPVHHSCHLSAGHTPGTDFNIDSLPLPRKARHDWALFHEESPKNNYKLFHKPIITLFNYTATFSRHSHLPLTTQYLEGVEVLKSRRYLVPLQSKNHLRTRLAPLVYVQSDCDPPSDRDSYVRELMAYIEVDSYGECLRNRDLPEQLADPASMDADGFYRILAQYKFILAFENAVCDDYITEKFWRPLKLGVVPVYHGSPSIADWLPSSRSAILVSAFSHPRELAGYIRQLDRDDGRYAAYIEWKLRGEISNRRLLAALAERTWGVHDLSQHNHIDAFECMVCTKVWDNIRLQEKGLPPKTWQADVTHLSCPEPTTFSFSTLAPRRSSLREMWIPSFQQSKKEAQALRRLVDRNQNFSAQEFWALVFKD